MVTDSRQPPKATDVSSLFDQKPSLVELAFALEFDPPEPVLGIDTADEMSKAIAAEAAATEIEFTNSPIVVESVTFAPELKKIDNTSSPAFSDDSSIDQKISSIADTKFDFLSDEVRGRVKRQAAQLVPFKLDAAMSWGSKALEDMAAAVTGASDTVHLFSECRAAEVLEDAAAAPGKKGLIQKLLSGNKTLNEHYSDVMDVQRKMDVIITRCEAFLLKSNAAYDRLLGFSAALSVAHDANGMISDVALEETVFTRRNILQSALVQAKNVTLQMDEVRRQAASLRTRTDQVINMVLPSRARTPVPSDRPAPPTPLSETVDRTVHYVDVGSMSPKKARRELQRIRDRHGQPIGSK